MSFVFPSWETAFSPAFHEDAKAMLEGALNKGNKPPVIQGRIEVVELSMGTQPPTLTLLEIGDLSLDRFRGILRLGYQGDAWLEVRCRVQANPLSHNPNLLPSSTLPLSTPLLASQPLLVPMTLRLSKLHLRAILILVVSASKGITLVFKNDPLQNVDVSSTFDSVEVIRGYLQQEIEGQLREMFREDLPGIIHRLSQRWFTGTGVGGKVEMPYRENGGVEIGLGTPGRYDEEEESIDSTDPFGEKPLFPPHLPSTSLSSPSINVNVTPRRKSSQQAARPRRSSAVSESPTSYTVFPDIEDYDPTYGLRPEGLPTHSGYEAFGRLWEKAREGEGRGLGSLMSLGRVGEEGGEEEDRGDVSDGEWDETGSFDLVELDESLRPLSRSRRTSGPTSRIGDDDLVEWETFPAVGGGTITRPRVYHSQSQIRAPSEAGGAMPSPSGTATGGSITARASSVGGASSTIGSLRIAPLTLTSGSHFPHHRATPGPGPSSLRRMVTSRSNIHLTSLAHSLSHSRGEALASIPASASYKSFNAHQHSHAHPARASTPLARNNPPVPRRQSHAASSSAARTSGSSWDTDKAATRSGTMSTFASSQLPSSNAKSMSTSKSRSISIVPNTPLTSSGLGLGVQRRDRSASIASTSPGTSFPPRHLGPGGITLPLNNSVFQLATLSHSAHTLSPYARAHEHIAVRSFPHLGNKSVGGGAAGGGSSGASNVATSDADRVKARRKRIYHLGKKGENQDDGDITPMSPDLDGSAPTSPDLHPLGQGIGAGAGYAKQMISPALSGSTSSGEDARAWRPASLTEMASRVMRPNYGRAPESRISYGFPPGSVR